MRECQHCRVRIRGTSDRCVLCGNLLSPAENGETEEIFPQIPPVSDSHLAVRIMAFISVCILVLSFAVRIMVPTRVNWPIFVALGLLSMWLSLAVLLRKSHNVPKTILWQATVVSLLSLFWDWQTGWRGWSLDFLVPIAIVTAIVLMYIMARIMRLSVRDYITYALLDSLLGMVPIVFLLLHWVRMPIPSILCVSLSMIFLAAIVIFQGESMRKELHKTLHL